MHPGLPSGQLDGVLESKLHFMTKNGLSLARNRVAFVHSKSCLLSFCHTKKQIDNATQNTVQFLVYSENSLHNPKTIHWSKTSQEKMQTGRYMLTSSWVFFSKIHHNSNGCGNIRSASRAIFRNVLSLLSIIISILWIHIVTNGERFIDIMSLFSSRTNDQLV